MGLCRRVGAAVGTVSRAAAQSSEIKTPLIPAKAGIQIHSEPMAGLIWIPAFAGMSGF
jgi:hypothetical protein